MTNTKTDTSRKALGKGLESLLPNRPAPQNSPSADGKPLEIPVQIIERNPLQTRSRFDQALLEELAASISATGVIQPVTVRPLAGGRYQLITGERRWLASKKAGRSTIPAVVREVSDEQALEMTIVENLQRADLNPMEQARAYQRLAQDFRMTQEQMALRTGKERASVSNFLRLLRLPASLQELVEDGKLTFGHGRALLSLNNDEEMLKAAQRIAALSMSVRQTETYVQAILHPESRQNISDRPTSKTQDVNVKAAQERLQQALGLKVFIEDKHGRGKVIIEYARIEDFDALLSVIIRDGESAAGRS